MKKGVIIFIIFVIIITILRTLLYTFSIIPHKQYYWNGWASC